MQSQVKNHMGRMPWVQLVRYAYLAYALAVLTATGCGGGNGDGGMGGAGGNESRYADEGLWLCRPGIAVDQCARADLSTTEIHDDGTTVVSDGPTTNPSAPFDCFVVYETADFSLQPGNAPNPSSTDPAILEALHRNGSRFRGTCRVYAPLYRQMTLGTYYADEAWEETSYFQMAYDDVAEAFDYYLRQHNQDRDIVLIGHSQGAHILTRLVEDRFESDEALRGQLMSALLIGAGGRIYVPDGELVGGNFGVVPLCSSETDTGCVIAFDSLAFPETDAASRAESKELAPGDARACVNPASFGGARATLAAAIFSRSGPWSPPQISGENVTTEWISYPLAFDATCGGFLWIGVADADRAPLTPFELQDYQTQTLESQVGESLPVGAGLHWSNFSLTSLDLVRIVEAQAAAR